MKIEMKYKKSTKGTHVYHATNDDSPLKTVYLDRDKVKRKHEGITVTIGFCGADSSNG